MTEGRHRATRRPTFLCCTSSFFGRWMVLFSYAKGLESCMMLLVASVDGDWHSDKDEREEFLQWLLQVCARNCFCFLCCLCVCVCSLWNSLEINIVRTNAAMNICSMSEYLRSIENYFQCARICWANYVASSRSSCCWVVSGGLCEQCVE